jgi:tRNA1(Val) A37 N6-methylase TrmN6
MSITLDYLPFHPEIKIYQDRDMFCINTDTMALGEFIKVYKEDVVLDLGTNNGALLLYANLFHPKKLIGLDINSRALELAKKNMEYNHIENYELIEGDAAEYNGEEADVIICNPPYFKTRKEDRGMNPYLALAKHEDNLVLEKLMIAFRKNVKAGGTVFMLFQTSRLYEVMSEFSKNKFQVKNLKFVYDINKEYSNVVLIKAVKGGNQGLIVEKPLIITR